MTDEEPNEQSSEDSEQSDEKSADASEQSAEESNIGEQSTEQSDEQPTEETDQSEQSEEQTAIESDQAAEQSDQVAEADGEPAGEDGGVSPVAPDSHTDDTLGFAGDDTGSGVGAGGSTVQPARGGTTRLAPRKRLFRFVVSVDNTAVPDFIKSVFSPDPTGYFFGYAIAGAADGNPLHMIEDSWERVPMDGIMDFPFSTVERKEFFIGVSLVPNSKVDPNAAASQPPYPLPEGVGTEADGASDARCSAACPPARTISTTPVVPLTRIRSPVLICRVAVEVPTTAGIPNSRESTAGCDVSPPASVTRPTILVKSTTHAGFVIWQTTMSPWRT